MKFIKRYKIFKAEFILRYETDIPKKYTIETSLFLKTPIYSIWERAENNRRGTQEKNSDLIQRIPRTISIKRGGRRPRSIRPMTRDPRVRFTGQLVQIPRSRIIINDSLPIPFEYRKEDVGKTVWNWGLRQFSHSNVAAITTIAASPR